HGALPLQLPSPQLFRALQPLWPRVRRYALRADRIPLPRPLRPQRPPGLGIAAPAPRGASGASWVHALSVLPPYAGRVRAPAAALPYGAARARDAGSPWVPRARRPPPRQ